MSLDVLVVEVYHVEYSHTHYHMTILKVMEMGEIWLPSSETYHTVLHIVEKSTNAICSLQVSLLRSRSET